MTPDLGAAARVPRFRRNAFNSFLAALVTLGAVAWATDLFRRAGLELYGEQFLAGILGIALALAFLAVPARRGPTIDTRVPVYDWILAAIALTAAAYVGVRYPELSGMTLVRPPDGMLTAAVVVVLGLEAIRRCVGLPMLIVVLCFIGLALLGHLLPGRLEARPVSFGQVTYYMAWDTSGIIGAPLRILATVVIAFILFGECLTRTGGSLFFTDVSLAMLGRTRGAPAKIAVFSSMLFGTISGSTVASVLTTGVVTIPMMKKAGYPPSTAAAIEAVAATGGQLMPPVMGAAAFLMAEYLAVPYAEIALAALIPAVLYYVALFIQADLEAGRLGIRADAGTEIPGLWSVLAEGWFFMLMFAVLIGALFWFQVSAELSALLAATVGAVGGLFLRYRGVGLTLRGVRDAVIGTGYTAIEILMTAVAAGMVIGTLNISGLAFGMTMNLGLVGEQSLALMLAVAAVISLILGMGMPTIGVYVLVATLIVPALVKLGVAPMAAHMFVLYYGMLSMITPPVAIGAFAAAAIAESPPMKTGFVGCRFGWMKFVVPFLFVGSPTLLMQGSAPEIIRDLLTAATGTWLVSAGIVGYFLHDIGPWRRILAGLAGFGLLIPVSTDIALWANIGGGLIGTALLAAEWNKAGRIKAAGVERRQPGMQ